MSKQRGFNHPYNCMSKQLHAVNIPAVHIESASVVKLKNAQKIIHFSSYNVATGIWILDI